MLLPTDHPDAEEQCKRLRERGGFDLLREGAAWAEITRCRSYLPRSALKHDRIRRRLESLGFDQLPSHRVLNGGVSLMIDCGHIPMGWKVRQSGPSYRPRIHWFDRDGTLQLTVLYYPEPWRRMAHLSVEGIPLIESTSAE